MQAMTQAMIDSINSFTKPLLAEDFVEDKMVFPGWLSPKIDGIRTIGTKGTMKTRSMKEIPNQYIREAFKQYQGLDGEFIYGEPTAEDCYSRTYSAVMKKNAEPGSEEGVRLFVFDSIYDLNAPFSERYAAASKTVGTSNDPRLVIVPQVFVTCWEDIDALEAEWLGEGYEGWMYRSQANQTYKQGRSSVKEAILIKGKRFKDSECVVLEVYPEQENTNEATTNELGRTKRSTKKEGLVDKESFGTALCRDIYTGALFYIGGGKGVTKDIRAEWWEKRGEMPGWLWKYKFFPIGMKGDVPRFPGWGNFRSIEEIDLEKAKFLHLPTDHWKAPA